MPGTGVGFELDRVRSDDSGAGRSYWWTTGEAMKLANGFTLVALGLLMAGCVQSTLEPASEAGMKTPVPIVVDADARYLYCVLAPGKAIRYGVTVGEDAQIWSGVAKIGSMTEWPSWTPTPGEHQRLGNIPKFVSGGPHNPMGAGGPYPFPNGT